jgi:dihydrofolate synthase/folylpolyglutamate synthase
MVREIPDLQTAATILRPYYDNTRTKYTLDLMRELMEFLGNPQNSLKIVHVAGTSGKTSTAYYVAALLSATGHKTGLTISPHVDYINERVQIDLESMPEAPFCAALAEFLDIIDSSGLKPSWFEIMVAFAYWCFAREQVDYAVVEVGLGGLHDGTNVVTSADKICVITDIGLDHTAILGNTLQEIAVQKAGIIQPHNMAFSYNQAPEIMEQLQTRATKQGAELRIVAPKIIDVPSVQQLPQFQQHNFRLAQAVVEYVLTQEGVGVLQEEDITRVSQIIVPGRMEVIQADGKTVILDGAHNAQKMTALFDSIRLMFPDMHPYVVAAFMEGEPERWHEVIDILVQNDAQLVLTDFYSEKDYKKFSVNPEIVADYCAKHGLDVTVVSEPVKAYSHALSTDEPLIVVTGSFYLLNHIRPIVRHKGKQND